MIRKLSPGEQDLKRGAFALVLALAAFPPMLRGQDPEARDAQAAFERFRVARLPWSWETGAGTCDEIVGRFCYRHDAGSDRPPPAEPDGVAAARDELLERLDAAARRNPADGWTAGQRVRYRIEAGRAAEAVAVAMGCRAEAWWCAALEGAARHAAGDFVAAERAFDRALAAMPVSERERWLDLAPILDADAGALWRDLGPAAREAFADRLWWSADPLWIVPGNERRSEHLARHAWDRMQAGAASAYGVAWGEDLRELLVRYGWPVGWERDRSDVGRLGGSARPGVVAHDPPGAKRFVPTLAAIADPAVAGPLAWPLDDRTPRSTYAPSYARRFLALEPQVAAFRRGPRTIVAVGWSLPSDLLPEDPLAGGPFAAGVLASEGPDGTLLDARDTTATPEGALWLDVPWPRAVVGVEALGAGVAARWRAGLELAGARPDLPAVSDLLLLEPGAGLPASLEEALPLARRGLSVAPGERLRVFWEAYPPPAGRAVPVTIALALRPRDPGLAARIARALRFSSPPLGAELRWTEILPPGAVVPRAAILDLPRLPDGEYDLALEIVWPGGETARTRRTLAIHP